MGSLDGAETCELVALFLLFLIRQLTGMKTINFLDVVFDLETGSYKPYCKPNNKIMYVHKMSNHPKNITKSLPTMIQNRLFNISSDENMFNQEVGQ